MHPVLCCPITGCTLAWDHRGGDAVCEGKLDVGLLAKSQAPDKLPVTINVLIPEVLKQFATLVDHPQQPLTGVMVFIVNPEVFRKLCNIGCQQGHLDFRRSGIIIGTLIFCNDG